MILPPNKLLLSKKILYNTDLGGRYTELSILPTESQ